MIDSITSGGIDTYKSMIYHLCLLLSITKDTPVIENHDPYPFVVSRASGMSSYKGFCTNSRDNAVGIVCSILAVHTFNEAAKMKVIQSKECGKRFSESYMFFQLAQLYTRNIGDVAPPIITHHFEHVYAVIFELITLSVYTFPPADVCLKNAETQLKAVSRIFNTVSDFKQHQGPMSKWGTWCSRILKWCMNYAAIVLCVKLYKSLNTNKDTCTDAARVYSDIIELVTYVGGEYLSWKIYTESKDNLRIAYYSDLKGYKSQRVASIRSGDFFKTMDTGKLVYEALRLKDMSDVATVVSKIDTAVNKIQL